MSLRELRPPPPAVNERLVASLERHLAAAKMGQLRSMAIVGAMDCGSTLTEAVLRSGELGNQTFQLMGAIDFLKSRLLTNLEEEEY